MACAASASARAQLFSESFESGDLDAGGWSSSTVLAGSTLTLTSLAAHRGQYGLRIQDTGTGMKGVAGTNVSRPLPVLPVAIYSRAWVRMQAWNGQGDGIGLWGLAAPQKANIGSLHAVGVNYQTALTLTLQAYDAAASYHFLSTATPDVLSDAGWHLVEGATFGVGTDAGFAVEYVDGAEATRVGPVENIPDRDTSLYLGEAYISTGGTGNFAGIVDVDDVAVDVLPLPSHLVLDAGGPSVAAGCQRVTLSLAASAPGPDGGAAQNVAAPYDVVARPQGAAFFSDSQCTLPSATWTLVRGSAAASLFARFEDAGVTVVTATQTPSPDFLPAQLALTVLPSDSASRSDYALNCGVADGGAVLSAALLLLLAARKRRRL